VLLFSVSASPIAPDGHSTPSDGGFLDFAAPLLAADDHAHPDVVHSLLLQRVGEARIAHADATVTSMTACAAGALIGTSAGHLVCLSWDLDSLWRVHVPELLRNNNSLGRMGVLRNYTALAVSADAEVDGKTRESEATAHGVKMNGTAGAVKPPIPAQLVNILAATGDDSAGGVRMIAYNPLLDFCAIVLGSGVALLLGLRDDGARTPSAQNGRWLCHNHAASITLEPRRMLATVGLTDGDVQHYYIGVPAGDLCPVTRRLSLSAWYFEPEDVGPASVVSWTPDGCALVVGWANRGLAVWSISGCRLMWTLPQVGGILPSTPHYRPPVVGDGNAGDRSAESSTPSTSNGLNHSMDQGVLSAAWGPEGLFLWASPRRTHASHQAVRETHLTEFTFYKNTSAASSSCQSEATRRAMFGADRVLLLAKAEGATSMSSSLPPLPPFPRRCQSMPADEEFEWQHLLIPHDYLWQNWPPRRVAVNDEGSYIAVAGKYGVALCAVKSQRWRVFGDVRHDSRRINCCALAWVGMSIVIGNEIRTTSRSGAVRSTFELLVFSRDEVESSAMQARRSLPTRPLIIDVRADGYLLLICEDSSVVLYKLCEVPGGSRIDMHEIYQVFLPTRETRANGAAASLPITRSVSLSVATGPALDGAQSGVSTDSSTLSSLSASMSVPVLRSGGHRELGSNLIGGSGSISNSSVGDSSVAGGAKNALTLPSPGGGIGVARIFPPLSHAGQGHGVNGRDAPVPTQIMLLRSTGSLVLLDVKHMMSVPLLRYVEHFWYTAAFSPPFEDIAHRPVWWAYGDDGTHVCFRDGMRRFLTPSSDLSSNTLDKNGLDIAEAERLTAKSSQPPTYLRPSASSRTSSICVEQWFDLDPEVYPLGLLSRHGMVLGATQGLLLTSVSTGEGYEMPSHMIQVKRQPILHTLLRHLLMKPMSDDRVALQLALKCVNQPQFIESLEWLLYEAVMENGDDESTVTSASPRPAGVNGEHGVNGFPASPTRRRAGSRLFPRVIRLLKYFGEYEDIVVRCARKMDSKRWPLLFSLAGEPAALLEQCFASGRLRTAACLLVILQEMWGFLSSTPHSLRLVAAALSRGELGLAGDLANFLSKASRAGMLNPTQLEVDEDVSWIAVATAMRNGEAVNTSLHPLGSGDQGVASRIPAVDLAVLQYAEGLLIAMDVRKLAALSVRMDFPLAAWLTRKVRGLDGGGGQERFVHDFGGSIMSLHRQFQYPEPSARSVRKLLSAYKRRPDLELSDSVKNMRGTSNGHGIGMDLISPRAFVERAHVQMVGSGGDNLFGSALPPPPSAHESDEVRRMRMKARHLCEQELIYLLTIAQTAGAADLAAVLAVLLLDVSAIIGAVQGRAWLAGTLIKALRSLEVPAYSALADEIEELCGEDKKSGAISK
jgi:RIC1